MEDISTFSLGDLSHSNFLTPRRVNYKQNGNIKTWDGITEHADVEIMLFNVSRQVFIFVQQFRPAVYLSSTRAELVDGVEVVDTGQFPGRLGLTIELCAGIVDKELPTVDIARAEVLEECGYSVPKEAFRKITSCRNGSVITGSLVTLYYAEVTDAMKVSCGGGLPQEGELIQVVELSVEEGRKLIYDESVNREPCLLLALQWFFSEVYPLMQGIAEND